MKLFLRLAWRNIWRHRRRTVIVVLSIGLTLSLMMLYDGMMAGFEQAIYGNAIQVLGGNIQAHANGYNDKFGQQPLLPLPDPMAVVLEAKSRPEVIGASRRISTGGLTSNRTGAFAVSIIGIEPEDEAPVSLIAQHVSSGRYLKTVDRDVILIGKGLADAMKVTVGDRFTLAGSATHDQMRSRSMTVAGIYDLGMGSIEKRTVYISLAEAQDLYGLSGQATEIVITLRQLGTEQPVIDQMTHKLPGVEVTSWQANFPDLTKAVGTKGAMMDLFGVIILFISGIGIFNMLMMAVYERTREIGVMGAMGMKPRQVSILFLLEGALIGLVGVGFGVVVGLAVNGLLGQVGIDFSKFSSLTEYTALITGRMYSTPGLEKITGRVFTTLIIATIAAVYPAREAALREPASALHYV